MVPFLVLMGFLFIGRLIEEIVKRGAIQALKVKFAQLLVFFLVIGIGLGAFITKIINLVTYAEGKKHEIENAIKLNTYDVDGVCFSKILNNGLIDITPFYENNIIVYYNDEDYHVSIPLTRPLFMSSSSSNALTWTNKSGWNKDKIIWSSHYLGD